MPRRTTLLAMLCIASWTSQAFAADLLICESGQECGCDVEEGFFDSCTSILESELIDVTDPLAVREVAGITVEVIDETGAYSVHADLIDHPAGRVLPVHPNQGQWDSIAELNEYINFLIFGTTEPEPPLKAFDECDMGTFWDHYEQGGTFARFDRNTGGWAPFQMQNVIFGVISGPDGSIYVDGQQIHLLDVTPQCELAKDGSFEGNQCSDILRDEGDPGENLCGERYNWSLPHDFARTDFEDFRLETYRSRFTWDRDSASFHYARVNFDEAFIEKQYFDESGSATTPLHPTPTETGDDHVDDERHFVDGDDVDGVCAKGDARREEYVLQPETSDGTAPLPDVCEFSF